MCHHKSSCQFLLLSIFFFPQPLDLHTVTSLHIWNSHVYHHFKEVFKKVSGVQRNSFSWLSITKSNDIWASRTMEIIVYLKIHISRAIKQGQQHRTVWGPRYNFQHCKKNNIKLKSKQWEEGEVKKTDQVSICSCWNWNKIRQVLETHLLNCFYMFIFYLLFQNSEIGENASFEGLKSFNTHI